MSPELRVATAPVSYGIFELTVDGRELPPPAEVAATMRALGYVGTELGPPGFFGDGARVGELLADNDLALVASFLPLRFARADGFRVDAEALEGTLDLLAAAAQSAGMPMILLCDAFCEPDRMRHAGAIEAHPETWLDAGRFALLVDNAHRAAEQCRARGFDVSFHYHAGTYVETPREIERFVARIDPSLLGLCLDTGHSAFGGGDGIDVLRDFGQLVNHVHLKDVDRDLLAQVHARGGGLEAAWTAGVFRVLGTGDANVEGTLGLLRERGYDGWLVVEQDRVLSAAHGFAATVEDQRRNREWLRERGV